MDAAYAAAVKWYTAVYYDDIEEYKTELREECEDKLAQVREDIENGVVL